MLLLLRELVMRSPWDSCQTGVRAPPRPRRGAQILLGTGQRAHGAWKALTHPALH